MMAPQVFVLDEPSSNLDADAILDLRQVIAYLKSLGKTVVLSEHRLYYLQGVTDRYIYMKDGRIRGDYTQAEFDRIPDGERKAMGLRAASLSALMAAPAAARRRRCGTSALPTKTRRKRCISAMPISPTAVLSASSATTGQGSPPSPDVSAAWKSAAVPLQWTALPSGPRSG